MRFYILYRLITFLFLLTILYSLFLFTLYWNMKTSQLEFWKVAFVLLSYDTITNHPIQTVIDKLFIYRVLHTAERINSLCYIHYSVNWTQGKIDLHVISCHYIKILHLWIIWKPYKPRTYIVILSLYCVVEYKCFHICSWFNIDMVYVLCLNSGTYKCLHFYFILRVNPL